MLSIIVSSYQEEYFKNFEESVFKTIGENFNYEIICVNNPNIMGICEAYNRGASKANFDYLLFIHEDVTFVTLDWGNILIDYLIKDEVGCIGIAGSSIKTLLPIGYWDLFDYKSYSLNQFDKGILLKEFRIMESKEVVLLDGVFLASKRSIWNEYKFNEELLKGFHGYDIDYSLRVSNKNKNFVINNIIINHFSDGSLSKDWYLDIVKIYYKNFYYKNVGQKLKIRIRYKIFLIFRMYYKLWLRSLLFK